MNPFYEDISTINLLIMERHIIRLILFYLKKNQLKTILYYVIDFQSIMKFIL